MSYKIITSFVPNKLLHISLMLKVVEKRQLGTRRPVRTRPAYLHGQVQSRVAVLALNVGVSSVSEQRHGGLKAPPLGQYV